MLIPDQSIQISIDDQNRLFSGLGQGNSCRRKADLLDWRRESLLHRERICWETEGKDLLHTVGESFCEDARCVFISRLAMSSVSMIFGSLLISCGCLILTAWKFCRLTPNLFMKDWQRTLVNCTMTKTTRMVSMGIYFMGPEIYAQKLQ